MKTGLRNGLRILGGFVLGILLSTEARSQSIKAVRLTAGLSTPLYACAAPGDASRIFIVEKNGLIRILKNGVLNAAPFLDRSGTVGPGEGGLLGMAFDPNYVTNGYFYVAYTRLSDLAPMVERYTVSANPDVADPATNLVIIGPIFGHPNVLGANHNGGCVQFGPDGMLYVSIGDRGGGINYGVSQSGAYLVGKLLRLDPSLPPPYVPASNPFVSDPNVRDEIWNLGLRNPWRFSFDRQTGDMFIADVGEGAQEEIDFEAAASSGNNYGWPCMEGQSCTAWSFCTCNAAALRLPIETFNHSFGCAVVGGYIYRGCAIPALRGTYFYAAVCSDRIWSFTYDSSTGAKGPTVERTAQLAPGGGLNLGSIYSFGEDAFGEILIVDGGGELYKIVDTAVPDCNNNGTPDGCDLAAGTSLDVNSNGVPDECDCSQPLQHCSAKLASTGCLPRMAFSGYPSATRGSGFLVRAVNSRNQKPGLLLYGDNGPLALPFQGGTLCVNPPIRRTTGVSSGGTPAPGDDCTGVFQLDMNAFAVGALGGNPAPSLRVPGTVIDCQWWGRDQGFPPPNNSQLADGLEFQVCP